MSSTANYDFFNNIDKYITEVKKIENTSPLNKLPNDCENFSKQFGLGNPEKAKSLCISFAKLNKFLVAVQTQDVDKCKFLNYWLNSELSQTWFSENNYISVVYNGMDSQLHNNDAYTTLNCNLFNINKDELHKMTILYNLYEKYSELNTITEDMSVLNKQSLLTLSSECCPHYLEASYICNSGNNDNSIFCEKITDLKSKNDALYKKVHGERPDLSDNFIRLSECRNTKIITTSVIGSVVGLIPLLGVLYKFTPMGQMFRSKIGILNNDISNNDEEMTNISLMEQENEQLKYQQGKYNIKYQSL
ncbi:Plasmodium vivax Vir protein, putative [Plasmodium vivax]|nr:Plasmodium vivax Vir protein, putative [Plasmodium vivax]